MNRVGTGFVLPRCTFTSIQVPQYANQMDANVECFVIH